MSREVVAGWNYQKEFRNSWDLLIYHFVHFSRQKYNCTYVNLSGQIDKMTFVHLSKQKDICPFVWTKRQIEQNSYICPFVRTKRQILFICPFVRTKWQNLYICPFVRTNGQIDKTGKGEQNLFVPEFCPVGTKSICPNKFNLLGQKDKKTNICWTKFVFVKQNAGQDKICWDKFCLLGWGQICPGCDFCLLS